jgi:hypothetical protein
MLNAYLFAAQGDLLGLARLDAVRANVDLLLD